jgi:hypothetical protein
MKRELAAGFDLPTPPKRTPVADAKASTFIRAPERRAPPSPSKLRRTELGERLVVYLPPELATELRVRCARERRSLSDAVTAAVEAWARGYVGT